MNDRRVLLMVSGNCFGKDSWDGHTARIWDELLIGFDELHIFARAEDQHFHEYSRGALTLHLIPRGPARMVTFFVSSWWLPIVLMRVHPTHLLAQCPVEGGVAAVFCGWLFRRPVLVELHGEHYFRAGQVGRGAHRWFFKPITHVTLSGATRIRSLSPDMTREIRSIYGYRASRKSVLVPNRVNLRIFTPPKLDYTRTGGLRIVSVGSLHPNKGHIALIRDIARQSQDCRLTLVGQGSEDEILREEAASLGLDLVIVGGLTHRDLSVLLREQDVYVHYSRSEAVSRAVLEAMAMGLPVVVTPVGFLGGIVDSGVTGLRLGDEGVVDLSSALQLLSSEGMRARLGRAARERIKDNHEWGKIFEVYRSAILTMDGPRVGFSRGGK